MITFVIVYVSLLLLAFLCHLTLNKFVSYSFRSSRIGIVLWFLATCTYVPLIMWLIGAIECYRDMSDFMWRSIAEFKSAGWLHGKYKTSDDEEKAEEEKWRKDRDKSKFEDNE